VDRIPGKAVIEAQQPLVVAGLSAATRVFALLEPSVEVSLRAADGDRVERGAELARIAGSFGTLLAGERVALNLLGRMSGIATLTRRFVEAVNGTGCKVLDTRKTTPTLRAIEKWAVRIGGGHNHRNGLYDMVMIKDNHADMAGGIPQAIRAAQRYLKEHDMRLPIEVETRNLSEVEQVLSIPGVQRIMLDNFGLDDLRTAVDMIDRACETEASGGITLATARAVADTGVEFLSVGALTHSAGSLDLSLKAMN
ncbi:MAG TPA: carboxylating nicotinate-nucleotide diphosphorylase, partial [Flavobacteriales bacterium]|nr:carboxylating nicotinate-nucleotide diphosphorylase [Flavobacteriales bacterium]